MLDTATQILGIAKSFLDTMGFTPYLFAFLMVAVILAIVGMLTRR